MIFNAIHCLGAGLVVCGIYGILDTIANQSLSKKIDQLFFDCSEIKRELASQKKLFELHKTFLSKDLTSWINCQTDQEKRLMRIEDFLTAEEKK